MSFWTDAHCHLQDEFFDHAPDAPALVGAALERARDAGVRRVVAIVGLHPHDATEDLAPVAELARSGHPRLVGIGECGLDYYYEHSPKAQQRQAFAAQIALAMELDLALVVHARDAFDDLFDVFESEGVPP